MLSDLDLPALHAYRSAQVDPPDFDEFWASTLEEARTHDLAVEVTRHPSVVTSVDVFDVSFAGFGGERIRAWLRVPAGTTAPLPGVVEFIGYGGGRGLAEADLLWAASGFAHLTMDTRGQGATWSVGATPDTAVSGPRVPGMMTSGIQRREDYYYRRLITDAVRAIEAARTLDAVDPARVVAVGGSQGGGVALAATALTGDLAGSAIWVPFLCDFPRATMITDSDPYREIARFLATHRAERESVHATLAYFDGVNFARRATTPAVFSAALMDRTCPPSTVFGAFHEYRGAKDIDVWHYNEHEGGGLEDRLAAIRFARSL